MTMAIVLLIILLTLAYFYLNCKPMNALATLITIVLATLAAFSFYGPLSQLLIDRGYGGGWATPGAFLVIFAFVFALLRGAADYLIGNAIDLGKPAQTAAAVVCGLLAGVFISGNLLVVLGMMPVQHKLLYNRFPAGSPIMLANPQSPALAVDDMVAGFYSWVSRGALASQSSFAVVQADFVTKNHINRHGLDRDIPTIAGRDSIVLPPKAKFPLRLLTIPDKGSYVVVRVGLSKRSIADGGAAVEAGQLLFFSGQFRLICKPEGQQNNLLGKGQAVWPKGIVKNGALIEKKLEEIIDADTEILGERNRVLWMDIAFSLPSGTTPVAIQFRQNVTASLIGMNPTATTPEIEQGLKELLKEE